MMNTPAAIYIDGASQGNPGLAGIGVVIDNGEKPINMYKYIGTATNNIAEYTALIYSLQEALILGIRKAVINSDSELLVKQVNGVYKVKDLNLRLLYDQFVHLKRGFKNLEVKFIKREQNKQADKLATQAINNRLDPTLKIS